MIQSRNLRLASIAVTLSIVYGLWYAYSVILVALLKEFGWSRSVLAGAFSVFTLVHGLISPMVGALSTRVQPRIVVAWGGAMLGVALFAVSVVSEPWHLYVSFGIFTAAAAAACGWVPALVQVQRDFRDQLGFAIGIASSGVGLGMFLVVPFLQALIDTLGWRLALRVFALVCMLWIIPSSISRIRRATRHDDTATSEATADPAPAAPRLPLIATYSMTLTQAMFVTPLWLMVAVYFLGNVAAQTLHVHQVAYFVDQGFTPMTAASVVSVIGLSSIVGKIGGGWLSDHIDREIVYVVGIAGVVVGIGVLGAVRHVSAPWAPYCYAVLFGAGYSVTASLVPTMVSDRFGGPHYGAIVGFGMMGGALGAALGAWLAGRLFDLSGTYTIAFGIAAACGIGAAAAAWRARTLRARSAKESLLQS